VTYTLPWDVTFNVQTGFPSPGPDNYGTGAAAIDFGYTANSSSGGATTIYFCPDGSAQNDSTGQCAGSWMAGGVPGASGRNSEFAGGDVVGRNGPHSRMAALPQVGRRVSMATSVMGRGGIFGTEASGGGFSLIEVLISMVILTVGR